MFKERLIKYRQLDKEDEKLYRQKEKAECFIESMVEKYRKEYLMPIADREIEVEEQKEKIKESIEMELRRGIEDFTKQSHSHDIKMIALKLLEMFEEYAQIDEFEKDGIATKDFVSLIEYFLKIEDVDLCIRTLKSWHKIDVGYSYGKLASRYAGVIGDFSEMDKSFKSSDSEFKKWKEYIQMAPDMGVPQELEVYKMIELLGKLDARHKQTKDKVYYSEKTKKAIIYASIGGFSRITKGDGFSYLIEPHEWFERPLHWAEKYRHSLMRVHDEAYLKEKETLKILEK